MTIPDLSANVPPRLFCRRLDPVRAQRRQILEFPPCGRRAREARQTCSDAEMKEIHERASKLSIAAQNLCFERGCHKRTPSDWWMSLTSQHLQTGVHCCLALRGLTMEMPQQDVGRVIDIEHDTLRAVTADLNNDWPFKSARAGHHSPLHPAAKASLALISLAETFRCIPTANLDRWRPSGGHERNLFMSGGAGWLAQSRQCRLAPVSHSLWKPTPAPFRCPPCTQRSTAWRRLGLPISQLALQI